jgi:hypothetical protein
MTVQKGIIMGIVIEIVVIGASGTNAYMDVRGALSGYDTLVRHRFPIIHHNNDFSRDLRRIRRSEREAGALHQNRTWHDQ